MSEILERVSDTVTGEPVQVTVDLKALHWWHRFFQPKQKTYTIDKITLGNLIRISKILTGIDPAIFAASDTSVLDKSYQVITKHGRDLADLVAIAIHNKKSMPPASLVEMVLENFTSRDLLTVTMVAIKQMNVMDFMTTITLARGLNILESQNVNAKSAKKAEVSL